MKYDFCGWATRNDLRCSDGRTIRRNAFKVNDGQTVPLVWNHQHNDPLNVLGHALLENREDGVYAYCEFNDTESGKSAKELVKHNDVASLSIYANQLKQNGGDVLHGVIREVSLVLAGANPGAYIESIMAHGDDSDEEAVIYTGEEISIEHSEKEIPPAKEPIIDDSLEHADTTKKGEGTMTVDTKPAAEKTVADVFDTLTEEQKTVVYALIGQALDEQSSGDTNADNKGGNDAMKHNVFDQDGTPQVSEATLCHADMVQIVADAKRVGTFRTAYNDYVQHYAEENNLDEEVLAHSITNMDVLFPDEQSINPTPDLISRRMDWVQGVINGTHHTPFSRVKSIQADITEDAARAKGYMKGKLKKEEVFSLLKRTTSPQTIYKKQKIDRDDVIDITDFDVVAWLKGEMRTMLDEEIARAVLVGDGRLTSDDDHISEDNVRPIWKDSDLYTIKEVVSLSGTATAADKANAFIEACIKSRKEYQGSGNPMMYASEDMITDCLLLKDTLGHFLYASVDALATTLRVSSIVTVPVMNGLTRVDSDSKTRTLGGIIVNLNDYNIGADKGGAINLFDDFDIDYNQQKYLIETRCSGALVKPKSAIAIEFMTAAG